jgi:hypothetical protein
MIDAIHDHALRAGEHGAVDGHDPITGHPPVFDEPLVALADTG